MSLTDLACKRVQDLIPYQSARRIGGVGRIYLNANESPEGTYNRYPDCQPKELLEAYANYAGVSSDHVIVGRGSDEIIGLICRTFCEPGREQVLITPPTYGMYSIAAETNGIEVVEVPLKDDFSVDIFAIRKAIQQNNIKVIFLCSPNNPLGTIINHNTLEEILVETAGKCIVVVDEAYIEFSIKDTALKFLASNPHLIITRTLSKAFGLAGIRCGFALADTEIVELLLKVIDPYPIPTPVSDIALDAFKEENLKIVQDRVSRIVETRDEFSESCKTLKCIDEVFKSSSNSVLIRFKNSDKVFSEAAKAGFILRDFSKKPNLQNCIRITIGTKQEMDELLNFLEGMQ